MDSQMNMTKNKLWALRQEIELDSLFYNDYSNDMGFSERSVCGFFDGYSEYLADELAKENNVRPEDAIEKLDNADNLWEYFLEYDTFPFDADRGEAQDDELKESDDGDDIPYWKKAMNLNDIIITMNNETAYMSWIDVYPDEETVEEAKEDFGTKEQYEELEDFFKEVYTEYHDSGLYDASAEEVKNARDWDNRLGLPPIVAIGGDTKNSKDIGESDETKKNMNYSRQGVMKEGIETFATIEDMFRKVMSHKGVRGKIFDKDGYLTDEAYSVYEDVADKYFHGDIDALDKLCTEEDCFAPDGDESLKTGHGTPRLHESDDEELSDSEIMDELGIEEENRDSAEYRTLPANYRRLRNRFPEAEIWLKGDVSTHTNGKILGTDGELAAVDESLKTGHGTPRLHESDDVSATDAPKCPCDVITSLIDDEKEAIDGYDKASMDINGIGDANSAASLALFAKIKQEELEHINELQGLLNAAKAVNGETDDIADENPVPEDDDKKIADAFDAGDDEPVFDDGNEPKDELKPVSSNVEKVTTENPDKKESLFRKHSVGGTVKTEGFHAGRHHARVLLANSRKPMNESATITKIMSLEEFQPWSGAVDTMEKIINANKLDELDFLLEDQYPDGIDETELNDLLWFESDWVLDQLGLGEEDIAPDEEEPEAKHDDGDNVAKDDTVAEDYSDICRNAKDE